MANALGHRAFVRFWSAAAVSNVGNWMQTITVPYVIYDLTRSLAWLGATAFATFIPSILGTIVSTGLVDRYERRWLLLRLQLVQMAMAVAMLAAWLFGLHRPLAFLVLSAIGGLVGGMVTPAWNSFVPLLVPREALASAVRLNSLQFALGRAIGPLIAGAVLKPFGPATTFGINSASFLFVVGVLVSLRSTAAPRPDRTASPLRQAIEGWRYVFARRSLVISPVTVLVCGFFGSCVVQLAAAITSEQFHRDPKNIGIVVGAFGTGSILGSGFVTLVGDRWRRSRIIYVGFGAWIAGLSLLAYATRIGYGMIALATMGVAHVVTATSVNTALQLQVEEAFRGRAIATYLQGFFGGVATGAFVLAHLADAIELRGVFLLGAGAIALYAVIATKVFDRMRPLDGTTALS